MVGFQNNRPTLPIKIGYTSLEPVAERIGKAQCDIYREPLVVLPNSENPLRPLAFVYLLEQILHAVFAHKQRNYYCPQDNILHSEIFYFDPVYGIDDELFGARIRIEDLKEQLNEWVEVVRGMEVIHERIVAAYTPLLDSIKAAFWANNKDVTTWRAK